LALTTLDATPALVVIDLQKGIVAMPTAHPVEAVHRRRPGRVDAGRGWARDGPSTVAWALNCGIEGRDGVPRQERHQTLSEVPGPGSDRR